MTNACIIGVSGFGAVHYDDLMREVDRGLVRVLAATIINRDQEADKCRRLGELGCEIFDDYKAMLDAVAAKADLCFIPVGIHLHAPMTIDALRAGANVFVEKPVAATIQDVRAMQAAERETGRFVAVGYQSMYGHEVMAMKRAILDGKLGKILSIKGRGLGSRTRTYYERNNWAGRLKVSDRWVLDSPFNNAMAHQLNVICFLAGDELRTSADLKSIQAELYRGNEIESADTTSMRIVTSRDIPLYFFVTHCPREGFGFRIVVRGELGVMTWNCHESLTVEYADGRREEMPVEGGAQLRENIFRSLVGRIGDPEAFICGLDIAGVQTLCVNGAHESSPVRRVDAEFLTDEPFEGSTRTIIEGVDEAILRGFERERLFSELDVPWSRPAPVFPLDGYETFAGPKPSNE